ncbi:hypothetical protein F5Y18DRAFT_431553 [Xylariaceae sp. FL1019]|nr:hypothetical protein F5Y18DRAFT_431553 [Xylariaceae sp. FL1019]
MGCPSDLAVAIASRNARYGQYVDCKEWEKLTTEIVLPDCRWRICDIKGKPLVSQGKPLSWDSAAEYLEYFPKVLAPMNSLHMFGIGEFEQIDDDTVNAVFSMEDQLVNKQLGTWVELRGGGFAFQTWKRRGADWYLQELVVKRTYQKMSTLVSFAVFLQEKLGIPMI